MIKIDKKYIEFSMRDDQYYLYSIGHLFRPTVFKRIKIGIRRTIARLVLDVFDAKRDVFKRV